MRNPNRNPAEIEGAVVHHADFWFHPSIAPTNFFSKSVRTLSVWCRISSNPKNISDSEILFSFKAFEKGFWNQAERVRQIAGIDDTNVILKPHQFCNGNSDFYYVSREAWPMFSSIIIDAFLPRRQIPDLRLGLTPQTLQAHEVVIPHTMIALRAAEFKHAQFCWNGNNTGLPPEIRPRIVAPDLNVQPCCWGSCCAEAHQDTKIYEHFQCGHKSAMQYDAVKKTLLKPWNEVLL